MKAQDFIAKANETLRQRGKENGYDSGDERSQNDIAALYNALTGQNISAADVCALMVCLKLVRNRRKHQDDSIVDLIGYAALWGETLSEGVEMPTEAEEVPIPKLRMEDFERYLRKQINSGEPVEFGLHSILIKEVTSFIDYRGRPSCDFEGADGGQYGFSVGDRISNLYGIPGITELTA